jgi:hypothetical protein
MVREAVGMTLMVGAIALSVPAMTATIRRSPEAFFWTGVACLATHTIGRWIYGW